MKFVHITRLTKRLKHSKKIWIVRDAYRCEQKRHGSDESSWSVESRRIRTAEKAEGGNKEIGIGVSETEANPPTHHTTSSQMSIPVWPHAMRRWTSCQSMDHRGRRQLRVVDRYLRRVCTGEWLRISSSLPLISIFPFLRYYNIGRKFRKWQLQHRGK